LRACVRCQQCQKPSHTPLRAPAAAVAGCGPNSVPHKVPEYAAFDKATGLHGHHRWVRQPHRHTRTHPSSRADKLWRCSHPLTHKNSKAVTDLLTCAIPCVCPVQHPDKAGRGNVGGSAQGPGTCLNTSSQQAEVSERHASTTASAASQPGLCQVDHLLQTSHSSHPAAPVNSCHFAQLCCGTCCIQGCGEPRQCCHQQKHPAVNSRRHCGARPRKHGCDCNCEPGPLCRRADRPPHAGSSHTDTGGLQALGWARQLCSLAQSWSAPVQPIGTTAVVLSSLRYTGFCLYLRLVLVSSPATGGGPIWHGAFMWDQLPAGSHRPGDSNW
jgi:hypothetical protein